jgi:exonuclease SbcC
MSILDLDMYEALCDEATAEGRELKAQLAATLNGIEAKEAKLTDKTVIEERIQSEDASIAVHAAIITKYEAEIASLQEQTQRLAVNRSRRKAKDEELSRARAELTKANDLATKLLNTATELRRAQLSIEPLKATYAKLPELEAKYQANQEQTAKLQALEAQLTKLKAAIMLTEQEKRASVKEAEARLDRAEREHNTDILSKVNEIKLLDKQAANLKGLPCADNPDMQGQCRLLASAVEAKKRIPQLEEYVEEKTKQLTAKSKDLQAALDEARKKAAEPNPEVAQVKALEAEIANITVMPQMEAKRLADKIHETRMAGEVLKQTLAEAGELEATMRQLAEQKTIVEAAEEAINTLDEERQKIDAEIDADLPAEEALYSKEINLKETRAALSFHEQGKARYEQQLSQLATLEAEIEADKKATATGNKKLHLLANEARAFGKNGIPAILIEQAIPEIEEEANGILSKIAPAMSVQLLTTVAKKTGGTKDTLDIVISDEQGSRPYESYSGGEHFRVDFAVRIALAKLLAHRAGTKLQTLVIDEGFGSQDADGIEKITECILQISDEFACILVISHIDSMKEVFPVQIRVEKQASGSVVTVES